MTDSVPAGTSAVSPETSAETSGEASAESVGNAADGEPAGPAAWLTLPEVADRLGVSLTKVEQMIRDRELLAVERDGTLCVPAELIANRTVRKHLPGVLTLLHDAGYNDEETLRWLYRADPTLPGTPAEALGDERAREVKRRAQALGF